MKNNIEDYNEDIERYCQAWDDVSGKEPDMENHEVVMQETMGMDKSEKKHKGFVGMMMEDPAVLWDPTQTEVFEKNEQKELVVKDIEEMVEKAVDEMVVEDVRVWEKIGNDDGCKLEISDLKIKLIKDVTTEEVSENHVKSMLVGILESTIREHTVMYKMDAMENLTEVQGVEKFKIDNAEDIVFKSGSITSRVCLQG